MCQKVRWPVDERQRSNRPGVPAATWQTPCKSGRAWRRTGRPGGFRLAGTRGGADHRVGTSCRRLRSTLCPTGSGPAVNREIYDVWLDVYFAHRSLQQLCHSIRLHCIQRWFLRGTFFLPLLISYHNIYLLTHITYRIAMVNYEILFLLYLTVVIFYPSVSFQFLP